MMSMCKLHSHEQIPTVKGWVETLAKSTILYSDHILFLNSQSKENLHDFGQYILIHHSSNLVYPHVINWIWGPINKLIIFSMIALRIFMQLNCSFADFNFNSVEMLWTSLRFDNKQEKRDGRRREKKKEEIQYQCQLKLSLATRIALQFIIKIASLICRI